MTTTKKRPPPWSDTENAALVSLYFEMLDKATAGQSYNKAAMIRAAQAKDSHGSGAWHDKHGNGILCNRSKQSIEAKLMNATAAHQAIDPNATTMAGFGYVPLGNMQASLKQVMHKELTARTGADEFDIMDSA